MPHEEESLLNAEEEAGQPGGHVRKHAAPIRPSVHLHRSPPALGASDLDRLKGCILALTWHKSCSRTMQGAADAEWPRSQIMVHTENSLHATQQIRG